MGEESEQIVVRTAGLTKVFRDFWMREKVTAVRELDLKIPQAAVYGLLGPNGSGKSTTLKMILGLMFPTRGRVSVFGKSPRDVASKARIGFLPEESYLYPFLDAHETLDYYGRLFHQPRGERKRRIGMLLEMVGLTGMAYRRVGEYSKGMQRRIGMAQALINDPDLLILDEPTAGMDPLATRQFKDLIGELSRRGKTVILSSHLLADMEDVCGRVGILFGGQLRSEGSLDELLDRQGLTQITTEALDEAMAESVQQFLAERGKQVIGVETPKDKLESLFLRIVREARAQRTQLAEVVDTGQVADFLRAEPVEGRQVIEELLAPAGPAAVAADGPASEEAAPPREEPAKEVLADLMVEKEPPAPTQQAKSASPAEAPEPGRETNRSLIDSLLDKEDKPESEDDA